MTIEFQLNCTGGWQSFGTDVVLDQFELERSLNAENEQQKDISASIVATGSAYTYFYANLIDSVNRYSNTICARVTFNECSNEVFYFQIENKDLEWCQGGACEMKFDLVQKDESVDCINNTLIADNHLGWFEGTAGTLIYPRFRYCDVTRPYGLLVAMIAVVSIVDIIINVLNIVIAVVNFLSGGGISSIPTLAQLLIQCDRTHPAPFIRTYTDNVCAKCSIATNATTNPIFYDRFSDYINLTFLTAFTRKGFHATNTRRYIQANAPNWTLRKLYRELSQVFNARYFLKGSTWYFNRKDLIGTDLWGVTPVIDLTTLPDSQRLIDKVCFNYNGEGKVSRLFMTYAADSTDKEGDTAISRFNGEFTDFSSPNYREYKKKEFLEFGAQTYTYDGIDSWYDSAIRDYTIGNGFVDYMGVLKLSSDIARLGKLIVYDGSSDYQFAEAIGNTYNTFDTSEWPDDDGDVYYPPPTLAGLLSSGLIPNDFQVKNYPMFLSPAQNALYPNLWRFHEIDMPDPARKDNITFNFKINFCCDYLSLDMYQTVQLNANDVGEINYVKIDRKNNVIELRGNLKN